MATICWNSVTLCTLCVARTTFMSLGGQCGQLVLFQRRAACEAEFDQRIELTLVERRAFGRTLHLDEESPTGDDDVHVGLGADVFDIRQIEHRLAVDDA